MFGFAERFNATTSEKLRKTAHDNFESLVKANPDLVRHIGQNPALYNSILPDAIQKDPRYKDKENQGAFVNGMISKMIEYEEKKARATNKE